MTDPGSVSGAGQAPRIDRRTAADLTAALVGGPDNPGLLQSYTSDPSHDFPHWHEFDPVTGEPRGRSAALVGVFARFAEIVIERLNQVPDKNLLAFLDLLGGERLPPAPARVALSFTLAAGRVEDTLVRAGTRVAAPPPPGAKDPVEFETERNLTVTAAHLSTLLTIDPGQDRYSEVSPTATAFPALEGDRDIAHILYLGDADLFGYPRILDLRLEVEPAVVPVTTPTVIHWERWDGAGWQSMTPVGSDPTDGLTRSGTIRFGPILPQPETAVAERQSRWIRARLGTRITPATPPLPEIRRIIAAVHLKRPAESGIPPDLGFANGTPLDLGTPFFPFGERPQRFDTLYLASTEALSKSRTACQGSSDTLVELAVTLANPHTSATADSVRPSPDTTLAWECWNGSEWQQVGTSKTPTWLALVELDPEVVLGSGTTGGSQALVQGVVSPGTRVTVGRLSQEGAANSLGVGVDGRFAARLPVFPGPNVFEFGARRGTDKASRSERIWAVVTVPGAGIQVAIELSDTFGSRPVVAPVVELEVLLSGADVDKVDWLRFRSGRGDDPPRSIRPGQPMKMSLEYGRNPVLIEALSGERLVAATALVISRAAPVADPDAHFSDGTHGLTESGSVRLRLPVTTARTAVNGQEGFWLRARITAGDYGRDASYVLKDPARPEEGFLLVPASFRPPVIAALVFGYELTPRRPPSWCLVYEDLDYTEVQADGSHAFAAFAAGEDEDPALYLGFTLPAGQTAFPRGGLDLYASLDLPMAGTALTQTASTPPRLVWEYWNGTSWAALAVVDETASLTRSGPLSLLPPADFAPRRRFGLARWWLRARLAAGEYQTRPRLHWLKTDTVTALQVTTQTNEILGSGNGAAGQVFRTARAPVLTGARLDVREPAAPGAGELAALAAELLESGATVQPSGADLITSASGRGGGVWVRWRAVPDFHGSAPGARHYVLNHLTGEVRFGDGVNGRVPPPGTSNIRLAFYQTGGGVAGNVAAGSVSQLKTTVPYVDRVTNPEPAAGGAEAETLASLEARIPRTLRHQDRAVTSEDLEDLALLASPEVARALCVPLRALDRDPLGLDVEPGTASVILVPRSTAPKPLPTRELLERVRSYLAARADATARLAVVGPTYVEVTVRAEVALSDPGAISDVERSIQVRLDAFLHPLTGGTGGQGWDFGRTPHRSDLLALIEQIPGVDHCRRLEIDQRDDIDGVRSTGRFLVHAGAHQIDLVFVET